ncbi:MAG: peptidoglycan bridge formation glycyltransferase FemA/FemB family protein [Nitrososphaeraceae archaeon]
MPDKNNYRIILKMLRKFYVENNERLLIVVPNEIEFGNFEIEVILKEEGFEPMEGQRKEQTIFIKLGNLDEIKAGMRRNWRKSLRDAENIGLDLILGTENEYLNISLSLYEQMHKRKRFNKITDMALLKKIHEVLPPERKFKILICKVEGEAIGAMVWAEFGDTGYPLLAATGDKGLKYGCSYLLWWKMITTMTGNGMRWCDMGGIDPDGNPGGYVFKTGLSGKTGLNTTLFKQFNAMNGVKNHIIFRAAEAYKKNRCFIRSVYRNRFIL